MLYIFKGAEQRMSHLIARLDAMEALLKEKESELDKIKQKLLSQPDLQAERKLQMQLEESNRSVLFECYVAFNNTNYCVCTYLLIFIMVIHVIIKYYIKKKKLQ